MYLDSSFELCPVCNEYVLLDQTQRECAKEHGCEGKACPFAASFTGREFTESEPGSEPGSEPEQGSRRRPPR